MKTAPSAADPSVEVPAEIRISDLTMRYRTVSGDSVLALDRVSLSILPKEFLCVVGLSTRACCIPMAISSV